MEGYEPYEAEIQEIKGWLATGPKTGDEFDEWTRRQVNPVTETIDPETGMTHVRPVMKMGNVRSFGPGTAILGSIEQGIGPDTWAGRLDLLQAMCRAGIVKASQNGDHIVYEVAA